MKKILAVYTGGTICSAQNDENRSLNLTFAKSVLLDKFKSECPSYVKNADELFFDSCLESKNQTLSESMTFSKLNAIINHIKGFNASDYAGIIVLHGTDTLAFTASLFSFVFADTKIPIMLVSGNRPPADNKSNANVNFKTAVELILQGITPNVYVPYQNTDGIMYLHLGTSIMQSGSFSDDFFSASSEKSFPVTSIKETLEKCKAFSQKSTFDFAFNTLSSSEALLIHPYTGLDYSKIALDNVKAIVHSTYHSGTVCTERSYNTDTYSEYSILTLCENCRKRNIPLIIAPTRLGSNQYSSVHDLAKATNALLLDMTTESAYTKLIFALSLNLQGVALTDFMKSEINFEFMG
ncbi:MAG: asparaginase [Clostridia bacterium]|nr:asparaginase [Clostridia bacterium]